MKTLFPIRRTRICYAEKNYQTDLRIESNNYNLYMQAEMDFSLNAEKL